MTTAVIPQARSGVGPPRGPTKTYQCSRTRSRTRTPAIHWDLVRGRSPGGIPSLLPKPSVIWANLAAEAQRRSRVIGARRLHTNRLRGCHGELARRCRMPDERPRDHPQAGKKNQIRWVQRVLRFFRQMRTVDVREPGTGCPEMPHRACTFFGFSVSPGPCRRAQTRRPIAQKQPSGQWESPRAPPRLEAHCARSCDDTGGCTLLDQHGRSKPSGRCFTEWKCTTKHDITCGRTENSFRSMMRPGPGPPIKRNVTRARPVP